MVQTELKIIQKLILFSFALFFSAVLCGAFQEVGSAPMAWHDRCHASHSSESESRQPERQDPALGATLRQCVAPLRQRRPAVGDDFLRTVVAPSAAAPGDRIAVCAVRLPANWRHLNSAVRRQ